MKKQIRKLEDTYRGQAAATAVIIVILVLVLALISWWMYDAGLLAIPASIERLLGIDKKNSTEVVWDLGELSEIVRSERHPDVETVSLEMTLETLRAAFLSEQTSPGLYISGRVSYYDEGEAVPHRVIFRRNAGEFRAEIYKTDDLRRLETLKIGTGTTVYIRDEASGSFRSLPLDDSFSPEHEAGIPSVAEVIAAVESFPLPQAELNEAESKDVSADAASEKPMYTDCELKLVKRPEGSVYYVKFTYADLGIREEYYVSLDYGIVLSSTTYHKGQPVYSYETLGYSTDPREWENASYYSVVNPG